MKKFVIFLGILLLFCLAENEVSAQFQLLKDTTIVVPKNWNGLSEIDKMAEGIRKYNCYSASINSKNYPYNHQIVPGDVWKIKIFSISSDDLITNTLIKKILDENGTMLGAEGLPILFQIRNFLPMEKWIISFDKKESLFQENNDYRIPAIEIYSDSYCTNTFSFENTFWYSQKYLLVCFIRK